MTTRTVRLMHESDVPDGTLGATIIVAGILVVVAFAIPPRDPQTVIATSLIDARAAAPADDSHLTPAANATEGNVTDLTY
jgi:hypothetical protein